jgi:hypothetical protein
MKNDTRFIVGGAAVGAVLGAALGWALSLKGSHSRDGRVSAQGLKIETRQLMRLGGLLVALVRQIIDLG